jgi:hypothetical protein
MSEGTGPSSEECHCADADGDHRFSYDEEPQSRRKHEEAAYDDDCRLGREFRCWAHCSLQMDYAPIVALTPVLGFVGSSQRFVLWGQPTIGDCSVLLWTIAPPYRIADGSGP